MLKKTIIALCAVSILATPMTSFAGDRNTSDGGITWGGENNYDKCYGTANCTDAGQRKAKKHSNTGTIIVASVAGAAVVAGIAWYVFKKAPSKNNPGQIKLAEF